MNEEARKRETEEERKRGKRLEEAFGVWRRKDD